MTSQLTTRRPFTPSTGPATRKSACTTGEACVIPADDSAKLFGGSTTTRGRAAPKDVARREPTSRDSFYEGLIFGAGGAVIAGVIMFILVLSAGG